MTLPRARLWLALVILLAGVASFAAPTREAASPTPDTATAPGYPMTVTDDGGTAVTLSKKPDRIVSVTLFTDEVLLDLVGPARLAAVTTFATDADISNVAARAANVPAKIALSVEPVLALNPDLVIVADWSDAAVVKQLRDAGVTVYLSAAGKTIPEIRSKILAVAALVGETAKGNEMVATLDARLAEVSRRVAGLAQDKRARVLDYTTWGVAMGSGSSWDEVVKAAGLVNAVATIQADQYGQVPLSKEKLVEIDPDLLILPGWVYGDPQGAANFAAQVRADPALKGMKAVRGGALHQMPERLKSTVSQYVAEAVEFLARTAYPDLFR